MIEVHDELLTTVDVGLRGADESIDSALIGQISRACSQVGAFVVTSHQVSGATTQAAYAASRRLFDGDESAKRFARPPESAFFGYHLAATPSAPTSSLDPNRRPKEAFTIGRELDVSEQRTQFTPRNIWPPVEGFKQALSAYYADMLALSQRLAQLFALSLALPDNFFLARMRQHVSLLTSINYPAFHGPELVDQARIEAQRDCGFLTLVSASEPCLEIQTASGQWTPVTPSNETFLVLVGSMLANWTSRQWQAPLRRIRPPRPGEGRRQSLAFFFNPDPALKLDLLSDSGRAKLTDTGPTITVGDYLRSMFELKGERPKE